ncbi:hypothetical protein PR048_022511 [Dryococelus australis]|uniref:Uncharacterized protein n=1 Tax=Dryococelus australis TaxID=614101 RepID=A0ABQ9H1H9_9NEOP|nr:hypothetical protein PR048_022511 [Dryococelus australis]
MINSTTKPREFVRSISPTMTNKDISVLSQWKSKEGNC